MLDKILRAPLPEQIVALLEKLEQSIDDASHLEKVEKLLDYHATKLTGYERWVIKRQMRKNYHAIRRAQTLNNVMSIVINEPTDRERREEERAKMYMSMNGTSGTLAKHAAMHNAQVAHIKAHQAAYQQALLNGVGVNQTWTDPRALYMNGSVL